MPTDKDQQLISETLRECGGEELTLAKALKLYETIYMSSRNFTPTTRKSYKRDLNQLVAFLEGNGQTLVSQVRKVDLRAFQAHLDRKGYAGTSRRRKTSAVRSLFRFLTSNDLIRVNPAVDLVPPQTEQKQPRVLTEKEYKALLRACSHETRDAAIIELLLQTGIRLSELARLTLDDVELPARISRDPANTGALHVKGKGRKERTITLNYKACKALKAWLKIRPNIDSAALFVTKFREPMGPRAFQRVVKKYLRDAGIKGASCHTLRHTMATHHVAKGTSLRTVQEALGHTDLKTTSIYVQLAREVMNKELQEHAL